MPKNYLLIKSNMVSKFEISLKECSETEGWPKLLFNTNAIDEETFKKRRKLCAELVNQFIQDVYDCAEQIGVNDYIEY